MVFKIPQALCAFALILGLAAGLGCPAWADEFPKPDAQGGVEVSLKTDNQTLVIFLSGDGGWWGDLDAQLADHLAKNGYAVLGLDTNVWFDSARQPAEVAARIDTMIRDYQTTTRVKHVMLIGYSFGADMVPLVYNRLPKRERSLVNGFILIAPGRLAALQVTLAERTGIEQGTLDLAPELAKLPRAKTRCIYGTDEAADSGCMLDAIKPALRIGLPGGHHFNNDMDLLRQTILKIAQDFTQANPASLRW